MSNTSKLSWSSSISELSKTKKIPKSIAKLQEIGISTLKDLCWIFPTKFYQVKKDPSPQDCQDKDYIRVTGKMVSFNARPIFKGRVRLFQIKSSIETNNGIFSLIWFNSYSSLKEKINTHYQDEKIITLEGSVSQNGPWTQMVNPSLKSNDSDTVITYPTVNKVRGTFIKNLIAKIPSELWSEVPELKFIDISLSESLAAIHNFNNIKFHNDHLERIKYEEFLQDQLKIKLRKSDKLSKAVSPFKFNKSEVSKFTKLFPYTLTKDQLLCLDEITKDLESGHTLSRLIQGDVGCGKTTIAIIAMKLIHSKGKQVALMAPTENLAFQHYQTIQSFFEYSEIAYLSSSVSQKQKKILNEKILNGEIKVIIGTHSLFQDKVIYKNLCLCIIDEQHKFGVDQRIKLFKKCEIPHCLLMSATPIPRTLRLSQYGDLDVSVIKEMPAHKKGFKTRIVKQENFEKFLSFFKTRLDLGEQAYIVLPNIDKTEFRDTHSIEEINNEFSSYFPKTKIETLHGKMDSDEQKKIIKQFRDGTTNVLISTTVVEVGIHVPNATLMIIYHPEYFGLSSLHQLRGRVGRDSKQGFCFLIPTNTLGQSQNERLLFFEKENDGFKISEQDLIFRGEGDLFGKNQSGSINGRRVTSIIEDIGIFNNVVSDLDNHDDLLLFSQHIKFYDLMNNKYIGNLI